MFNTPWSSPLLSWVSVHRRPLAIGACVWAAMGAFMVGLTLVVGTVFTADQPARLRVIGKYADAVEFGRWADGYGMLCPAMREQLTRAGFESEVGREVGALGGIVDVHFNRGGVVVYTTSRRGEVDRVVPTSRAHGRWYVCGLRATALLGRPV